MRSADHLFEELSQLLGGLADETLDPEQQQRLACLLRDDPAARVHYVRYVEMLASLHWHCLAVTPTPPGCPPGRRLTARAWAMSLAAAAVLFAVVLAAYPWLKPALRQPDPVALASLQAIGKVLVTRLDGRTEGAVATLPLRLGDTVRAEGGGRAILTYPEGTRLELAGGSLTLADAGRKTVTFHTGQLTARIAPQVAGRPMVFLTPRVEVQVLGTAFMLSADPRRTDLAVTAGRVRVSAVDGRGSVQVDEGQFAVARDDREVMVRNVPQPPAHWSEDFEMGLPADWLFGELTAAGLPPGSRGGVRTSRIEREDGTYREISTPKAWSDGLFAIRHDSVFHFTFRVERSQWFQIFVSTRPFDPESPPTATYRYKDNALWSKDVGQWKTVSIPLSHFERVSDWSGVPPVGEVPFQVLFSSKDVDPGLVVDRVWVDHPR